MPNPELLTVADTMASRMPLDRITDAGKALHMAFAAYIRECGETDRGIHEALPELTAIIATAIVGISCGYDGESLPSQSIVSVACLTISDTADAIFENMVAIIAAKASSAAGVPH
jgi:hypothetical protein